MASSPAAQHKEVFESFPYPPYGIQQQLMTNVYKALQNKQIGLFESPTGTGKTLSLICSTLKWLEDERRAQEAAAAKAAVDDNDLPDWMHTQSQPAAVQLPKHPPARTKHQQRKQQGQQTVAVLDEDGADLSEFLLAEEAGPCTPGSGSKRAAADAGYISSSSSDDDQDAAADTPADTTSQQQTAPRSPQLIFCSRTHSQLSQFVGELHRTRYADSVMLVAVGSRKALCVNDEVLKLQDLSQINERCLDLQRNRSAATNSSNKAAAVEGHSSSQQVVSFMQQGSSKRKQRKKGGGSAGCPYMSVAGGAASWESLTDMMLAAPVDVEELANLGRRKKICPYYGSRRAVPQVDVILAPYSTILMPDARESMGIQLKDAVVVFDEAHNLLDAINGAHSTAVSAWQLLSVQRSLTAYYERFKSFLNPTNAQNIQLMLRIAAALHKCITQQPSSHGSSSTGRPDAAAAAAGRVVAVNDLLFELGIDNINMFDLARWVKDNKMAFKVSGYTAAAVARSSGAVDLQQQQKPKHITLSKGHPLTASQGGNSSSKPSAQTQQPQQQQQQQAIGQLSARDGVSAIHSFVSFLLSLTNSDADGRIIIQAAAATATDSAAAPTAGDSTTAADQSTAAGTAGRGGHMRYILLNAARHFGRLLASARSVLLVSGTLAPIEGLRAQLFPDLPNERVVHFECGHVVPADQLLAVSVGRGPSGTALNLRHDSRHDSALIDELGQLLLNIASVVPEGLVVFAPSFVYLEQLVARWNSCGIMARLQQRKQVFREPRSATEVEQVLSAYAAAISSDSRPTPAVDQPAAVAAEGTEAAAAANGDTTALASSPGRGGGAVMLCVVGGKLSEGINFGDGLGRCVVMLGMPYPNPSDPELRERMAYLDKQAATGMTQQPSMHSTQQPQQQQPTAQQPLSQEQQQHQQQQQQQHQQCGASVETGRRRTAFQVINASSSQSTAAVAAGAKTLAGKASQSMQPQAGLPSSIEGHSDAAMNIQQLPGAAVYESPEVQQTGSSSSTTTTRLITGREYYDDLCFKAVNQCVGRVVRHKGDYAAIVLVDTRWVVSTADWETIRTAQLQAEHQATEAASQQQQQQSSFDPVPAGGSIAGVSIRAGGRLLPVQKLPGWVQRSFVPTAGEFGQAYRQLAQFFKRHKQQQQQRQG